MENWKAIPEWEGYYEVSDQGRVRSVERTLTFSDGRVRKYKSEMLKLKINTYGYPLAALNRGVNEKFWVHVHLLVLKSFVGPRPENMEGCHNNGVKTDARLVNLRYDTRRNNARDKMLHGTSLYGDKAPSAKFNEEMIEKIKQAKGTVTQISEALGVSRTHVWNVRNGKRRDTISEILS